MAVFVPNPPAWHFAFKSWQGMTGRFLYSKTLNVNAVSKSQAPGPGKPPHNRTHINYSTGALEKSIHPQRGNWGTELEGRVIALSGHAGYVHNGTAPHVIVAKKPGGSLRFFWHKKAKMVITRAVKHPGTRANEFLLKGLKQGMKM